MKKKKESIVVFEDWFRYARCLNDTEFRVFMSAILNYYKTQEQPNFTGLLLEVWNDIIDDLEKNVSTRQAKRDTMLKNSKSNSKLNTKSNIVPDTGSNIEPNTLGMVDGRLDMEDKIMEDNKMMNKHWSPVILKGQTAKYNTELINDYNKFCKQKPINKKKIMKWDDNDDNDVIPLHHNHSVSESLRLSGVSNIDDYWET